MGTKEDGDDVDVDVGAGLKLGVPKAIAWERKTSS